MITSTLFVEDKNLDYVEMFGIGTNNLNSPVTVDLDGLFILVHSRQLPRAAALFQNLADACRFGIKP